MKKFARAWARVKQRILRWHSKTCAMRWHSSKLAATSRHLAEGTPGSLVAQSICPYLRPSWQLMWLRQRSFSAEAGCHAASKLKAIAAVLPLQLRVEADAKKMHARYMLHAACASLLGSNTFPVRLSECEIASATSSNRSNVQELPMQIH